jgi:uncharacterized protein YecT (DUF1311 family)
MKRIAWIILGCLTLVASTHATSFDCAKAGNQTEKIICSDERLSKLDDELNSAYRAAIKDESQSLTIKQTQKQWMKDRNDCPNADCVIRAYQKRLSELTSNSSTNKKYSPYSDVWQWELKPKYSALPIQLFLLSNGDVLEGYEFVGNKLLFGGQTVVKGKLRSRTAGKFDGALTLSDGTLVTGVKGGNLFGRLELTNGLVVESNDNWRVKCFHGPVRDSLSIFNGKKYVDKANKVIFVLLDKPEQNTWDKPKPLPGSDIEVDPCNEEGPPGFTTKVRAISGAGMLPLDDGTFLMPIGNDLIVRFDEHFNTKSQLLNHRFFVFDLNDSNLFIDKINGKYYDLEETGYQPIYDDLYNYLTGIRDKHP